jgi:hypothetical protein
VLLLILARNIFFTRPCWYGMGYITDGLPRPIEERSSPGILEYIGVIGKPISFASLTPIG